MVINKKYKYFAFIPQMNKIVFGWEIIDDVESLKYYAKIDMQDLEFRKDQWKLLSANGLIKKGINPYDSKNWATSKEEIEFIKSKGKYSGTMGKLKKGSKEAKDFMAKIRAKKRKAPKKRKVSGAKESKELRKELAKKRIRLPHGYETAKRSRKVSGVHNDTKSHNYRINISGIVGKISNHTETLKSISDLKTKINNAEKFILDNEYKLKKVGVNSMNRPTKAVLRRMIKKEKAYIKSWKKQIIELKKHL